MKSDALIDEVIESPELPFVIHRLQAVLEAERPLREKFYDEITEDGKVEFINGKVIVQSPARLRHIQGGARLLKLVDTYTTVHKLGLVTHEKALVCLTRNDYEPDLCFFGPEKARELSPGQLKFPAPDWVCEVLSESAERIDRQVKFQDYALHGIGEYWIVDTEKERIEIYGLKGKAYELKEVIESGMVRSAVIAGFEMPVRAAFDDDEANQALRKILAS